MMDGWLRDLRFGLRSLMKTPGFTAVVVLTLGLGIGANTAIFSLLDQAVLRSLPGVSEPASLVLFDGPGPFRGRSEGSATFSHPMYREFRERTQSLSGLAASYGTGLTAQWDGQADRVRGSLVSGNFFQVLGVLPAAGRVFSDADDVTVLGHQVAVLDHGYWTRRFGANPSVIGRAIVLNGTPMTIVGVAAAGFRGVSAFGASDVYVPVRMKKLMTPTYDGLDERRYRWLTVIGRRKAGVTEAAALAELNGIYKQINAAELALMEGTSKTFRDRFLAKNLVLLPGGRGRAAVDRNDSAQYYSLMAMVGLVLLIVCANVANLLLARGAARRRETAVRLALGANRRQLIRQSLAESAVLAGGGALVGLALGLGGQRVLIAMMDEGSRDLLQPRLDPRMLAFAFAVTVASAVLAGLGPALHAAKPGLVGAIKAETGNVMGGRSQLRLRRVLVGVQMALSVLLLAGATLFSRSLINVRAVDPGVTVDDVLTFSVDPGLSGYSGARVRQFYESAREAIRAVPGVTHASVAELALLATNSWRMTVSVDGYTPRDGEDMNPDVNAVTPGFFQALGVPLLRGRDLTPADVDGAQRVAVVSRAFAKYFFGDANPVGRTFHIGQASSPPITIVGEARDVRSYDLRSEPVRFFYQAAYQDTELGGATFYVSHAPGVGGLPQAIREAIGRIDPNVPVFDVRSLREQFELSVVRERLVAALASAFGVMATLLAAIGLYGVMAFSVTRRTRELGVRMALGAAPGRVLWMVLREVAIITAIGAVAGMVSTWAVLRAIGSQLSTLLFGLSVTDPVTYVTAFVLLSAVAFLAGFLPARRATKISPTVALREG